MKDQPGRDDIQRDFIFGLLFFIFTPFVYALNPIKWSLNEPFPKEIFVAGGAYSITYTFTNQLPFSLVKPIVIEKAYSPETEFTFQDHCSGLKLTSNQSCTLTIMLDPIVIGLKEVQLTIAGYDNNRIKLPLQSSIAIQQDSKINILSSVLTALPSSMVVNTSNTFVFQFTNTGTKAATGVTTQCSHNHCSTTCSATLLPGASCEISGVGIFPPVLYVTEPQVARLLIVKTRAAQLLVL